MLRLTLLVVALSACAANAQWRFAAVYRGTYEAGHTDADYLKADQAMEALADGAYGAILSCRYLQIKDPDVYALFSKPAIQMIFYSNQADFLKPLLGKGYERYCGVTDIQNHVIYLDTKGINGACGALMETLMHEMFHLAGLQHQDMRPEHLFQDFIYTTSQRCYNEFLTRKAK